MRWQARLCLFMSATAFFRCIGFSADVAKDPRDATKDRPFVNSLGMKLVPVRGTKVLACVWETRVRDFAAFVRESGYDWNEKPPFQQTPDDPAVRVSWDDAKAFCAWLSQKEGRTYRLPTDREWDSAAGKDKFPWGDQWPPPKGADNIAGTESVIRDGNDPSSPVRGYADMHPRTAPVGSYKANKLGIYDIGGNVREWIEDWYNQDLHEKHKEAGGPEPAPEQLPEIKAGNVRRAARGGHWWDTMSGILATARRFGLYPDNRNHTTGFRCVLEVPAR